MHLMIFMLITPASASTAKLRPGHSISFDYSLTNRREEHTVPNVGVSVSAVQ